uniref:Uncharacterized protein n=1 Tax=Avena sativa TaxID=4498 RepID=A0ACD6AW10_AVESA
MLPNLVFTVWHQQDIALISSIISTSTEEIQDMILFAASAQDAWTTLAASFSSQSNSRFMQLHHEIGERFSFRGRRAGDLVESWFHSRALTKLQELHIRCRSRTTISAPPAARQRLPLSALCSASTLLVASISDCYFPNDMPSMNFAVLKQLSLISVSVSGEVIHGLLASCHALQSLYMSEVGAKGCLRIISPTLRSIGFRDSSIGITELVIEDAPHLVKLLIPYSCHQYDCVTIRVISAPKLEILGPFLPVLFRQLVSQGISPVSLSSSMRAAKGFRR